MVDLKRVIEEHGIDGEELGAVDRRFTSITALVQQGAYDEAADKAGAIIEEGVRDIRLVCYVLYAEFLSSGPASLAGAFDTLRWLVEERWEAVVPKAKKDVQSKRILEWLLARILGHVKRAERRQNERWTHWLNETTPEQAVAVIESSRSLRQALDERFHEPPVCGELHSLELWLREFRELVEIRHQGPEDEPPPPPEPAEPPPPPPPQEWHFVDELPGEEPLPGPIFPREPGPPFPRDGHEQDEAPAPRPPRPRRAPPRHEPPPEAARWDPRSAPPRAGPSPHMEILRYKLALFQELLARGELRKAAVVAADLQVLIREFDPVVYLPELFLPYVRSLGQHADALGMFWQRRDEPSWQALELLYRADPEGFLGP